jgi:hypothetical protein
MTHRRRALVVVGVLASVLLVGCGSATPSGPGLIGSQPTDKVSLMADKFACVDAKAGRTCTLQVTYTNGSSSAISLDASETRVLDARGEAWRASVVGAAPSRTSVPPGASKSYLWTLTVPTTTVLSMVRWTSDLGDSATAPLAAGSSASPTPTDAPSPSVTPTPTATPSKSPKPTKTPSSGGGHTSRPSPSASTPHGTIG